MDEFNFADWLATELKKKGWDPIDLDIASGISRSSIELYMRNKQYPTLYSFERILEAFDKHIEIVDN